MILWSRTFICHSEPKCRFKVRMAAAVVDLHVSQFHTYKYRYVSRGRLIHHGREAESDLQALAPRSVIHPKTYPFTVTSASPLLPPNIRSQRRLGHCPFKMMASVLPMSVEPLVASRRELPSPVSVPLSPWRSLGSFFWKASSGGPLLPVRDPWLRL